MGNEQGTSLSYRAAIPPTHQAIRDQVHRQRYEIKGAITADYKKAAPFN